MGHRAPADQAKPTGAGVSSQDPGPEQSIDQDQGCWSEGGSDEGEGTAVDCAVPQELEDPAQEQTQAPKHRHPLSLLDVPQLRKLALRLVRIHCPRGTTLLHEGESALPGNRAHF
jgi:hypothetical protein